MPGISSTGDLSYMNTIWNRRPFSWMLYASILKPGLLQSLWCENGFLCLSDWRELVAVTISRQKLGLALGSSVPSSDFAVVMQKKLSFTRKVFSLAYFERESFGTRKWPIGIEEVKVSQTFLSFTFSRSAMKACDHSLRGTKHTCFRLAM